MNEVEGSSEMIKNGTLLLENKGNYQEERESLNGERGGSNSKDLMTDIVEKEGESNLE